MGDGRWLPQARSDRRSPLGKLPSLEVVLLVAHDARCVSMWDRDGKSWSNSVFAEGTELYVTPIGCRLDVDTFYRYPLA